MTRLVTALQGESIDALIWRATGQGAGAVELVLEANPGIAETSAALAEGTPVSIPDLPSTPAEVALVQLWD